MKIMGLGCYGGTPGDWNPLVWVKARAILALMKHFQFLFAALLLNVGAAIAQPLVIKDVTVVDVALGKPVPGQTVVVDGDRITAAGPSATIQIPADARVVGGKGRFLMPGLWDMHVHTSSDRLNREIFFPLYIANGVTGIRTLKGDCFEPCGPLEHPISAVHQWRKEIAAGELLGPRIIAGSPIIYGPGPGEPSSIEAPATEEHGRALARLLAARGVDFIKIYDQLPREAFYGLLREGKRLGLPVVGHVPLEVPVSEAARAGMRSMEHLYGVIDECSTEEDAQRPKALAALRHGDTKALMMNPLQSLANFSIEKCTALYDELARHEIWHVPTLVVTPATSDLIAWRDRPAIKYLPRVELEGWLRWQASEIASMPANWHLALPLVRYRIEVTAVEMFRAGVPLLAGSDALAIGVFPGFALHDELEALVRAGLTPAEALRAATLEPARYLEALESMGTVEAGKVADLVLLAANPLEDITNTRRIEAVVANGRFFDRVKLDAILQAAEQAAK